MKNRLLFGCSTLLLTAFFAAAQTPAYPPNANPPSSSSSTKGSQETVDNTKVMTDSGTQTMSTDKMVGKVEAYEVGKSIKVTTPGKTEGTRTVDLQGKDITAHVNSKIKTGSWVSIVEKTDNAGHKTVTVEPSTKSAQSH